MNVILGIKLTDEQLVAAFKNIGIDITCGGCACVFFTGQGANHTCDKYKEPVFTITFGD